MPVQVKGSPMQQLARGRRSIERVKRSPETVPPHHIVAPFSAVRAWPVPSQKREQRIEDHVEHAVIDPVTDHRIEHVLVSFKRQFKAKLFSVGVMFDVDISEPNAHVVQPVPDQNPSVIGVVVTRIPEHVLGEEMLNLRTQSVRLAEDDELGFHRIARRTAI